jgi:hypothetical protein
LSFTAAVGAVEIAGQQICTAALVDVDASAQVGGFSASGRQVVLGGACLNRLSSGYIGGAVFVTTVGRLSVRTPIIAVDLAAGAGFGVGILSDAIPNVTPLKPFVGFSASAHAGVQAATILRANRHGVLVGASVELEAGVEFNLKTTCSQWHFKAELEAGVGVAASVGEITGAAAIVKVGGELQFAGSIDGQCVARRIGHVLRLPLDVANAVVDAAANAGAGQMLATYELPNRVNTVRVHFYESATELRLNGRGRISAATRGATCDAVLGSCTLRPAGGFAAGSSVDVTVDLHFPDVFGDSRVLFSVPQ